MTEIYSEPKILLSELKHKYTMELISDIEIKNVKDPRFQVYFKYQKNIHKEEESKITLSDYNRSWGKSNLIKNKYSEIHLSNDFSKKVEHPEIFPKYYGTYNIIHKLDGKIFAVGVWDILPHGLSSVYLYYDTDYSFLNPGILTAIKEIEYVKEFNGLIDKNFKYYLMGFYIDTCQKMRYKGYYHPTELLDPITGNYVYLDDVREIIKDNKVHKLSKEDNLNYKAIAFNEDEINKIFEDLTLKVL